MTLEITTVEIRYFVDINKWDKQHNCSDGISTYGPYETIEEAQSFLKDKNYNIHGPYYRNGTSTAIVRKNYKEI
jgi:hypothetical protein